MTQDSLHTSDSVSAYYEPDSSALHESISFFTEQESRIEIQANKVDHQSHDWMFGVIFLGYVLFTIVQVFNRKKLNNVIRAFFAKRLVNQLAREANLIIDGMSVTLFFVFISSFSLLIYLIIGEFFNPENIENWGFIFYSQIFIGVLSFIFLKFLMIKISEVIFKTRELSSTYLINYYIFVFFEGLSLLPLLTLVMYLNEDYSRKILIGSVIFILLIYVFRLFRGLQIGLSSKKFQLFQLLLYFCTHEIVPIMIVAKLSMDYFV